MAFWNLSVREKLRYKRIDWLMPSVDVVTILEKLGVEQISVHGDEVHALCPDHKLFMGRESSDPAWSVNSETGETNCFTEGRGSNLVWTVTRMLDIHPKEAVKFLMQTESEVSEGTLQIAQNKKNRERMGASRHSPYGVEGKPHSEILGLSAIERDMDNRYMSERSYQFFIHPPGKPHPTNIQPATVDHYKIFERTYGQYSNRVVIPYMMKGKLVGFCAIDVLGKKRWLEEHPLKVDKDYKKVLYPKHFISAGSFKEHTEGCLFGFDDCEKGCDILLITEGAREVMKFWQEGYNAVAILGAHLGEGQFKLITELAPKRVALMFDGDTAGRMIMDRVEERLSRNYTIDGSLIRCNVPWGKDPKNLDPDEYERLLNKT
jgi:hypothetical protein